MSTQQTSRGVDFGDRGDFQDKEGGLRRGRRRGPLGNGEDLVIDYKDVNLLRYFITDRGKIIPRRVSNLTAKQQRELTLAIKRARVIGFLPFTANY